MNKFWVIQLIAKDGPTGWVISNPPELLIVEEYVTNITRFDSWESANMFVKDNKLNQENVIVKIYSNEEIMEMKIPGIKPLQGSLYYLETEKGEKCCNSSGGDYYFKRTDVGYCVWQDPSHITPLRDEFISQGIHCDVKEIKQN